MVGAVSDQAVRGQRADVWSAIMRYLENRSEPS